MLPRRTLLPALAALALSACATTAPPPVAETVAARAEQRWALLIEGKSDAAYDYLSPGYRSTVTREQYALDMRTRPVRWLSARFRDEFCESDACTVTMELEYEALMPMAGKVRYPAFLDERWIRLDGRWYHVPEKVLDAVPEAVR